MTVVIIREPKPLTAAIHTGPVFLTRYIGKGKLTMGQYPNANTAKMACEDVSVWVGNGDGTFRSEDGRTLIERPL